MKAAAGEQAGGSGEGLQGRGFVRGPARSVRGPPGCSAPPALRSCCAREPRQGGAGRVPKEGPGQPRVEPLNCLGKRPHDSSPLQGSSRTKAVSQAARPEHLHLPPPLAWIWKRLGG